MAATSRLWHEDKKASVRSVWTGYMGVVRGQYDLVNADGSEIHEEFRLTVGFHGPLSVENGVLLISNWEVVKISREARDQLSEIAQGRAPGGYHCSLVEASKRVR